MPIPALRAKQSTNTTGTGTVTLLPAPAAARSLQAAFGTSARVVRYVISGATFFEIGVGTFDGGSPGTLTRATVLASSNAGALVSLVAGTADVFAWLDPGAERTLIESTATTLTLTLADIGNQVIWSGTAAGTLALPALATVPPGGQVHVRNSGTARLTVDPNGAELVNGATTLDLLPGDAASIVAATGGWVLAGVLPGLVHIRSQVAAAVAQVDFTLPAGFAAYEIRWWAVRAATDGASLLLRTSTDGGSTFAGAASDYNVTTESTRPATNNVSSVNSATSTAFSLTAALEAVNAVVSSQGTGQFWPGDGTRHPNIVGQSMMVEDVLNTPGLHRFTGLRSSGTLVNAIRFLMSSGNITAGTFSLYGVR